MHRSSFGLTVYNPKHQAAVSFAFNEASLCNLVTSSYAYVRWTDAYMIDSG